MIDEFRRRRTAKKTKDEAPRMKPWVTTHTHTHKKKRNRSNPRIDSEKKSTRSISDSAAMNEWVNDPFQEHRSETECFLELQNDDQRPGTPCTMHNIVDMETTIIDAVGTDAAESNAKSESFLFLPQDLTALNRFWWAFIQLHWLLLAFTGFLLGFTGFYWVLLGFTGFYWLLLGFTGFLLGFTRSKWVLLGFTGFYWVLLGFTGFYWVLLGFTGFN